ncbi:MAG: phage integrase N-terminal SAM-like domain-containing protein, partial [Candidatus Bathyarchaeia archaeon]
MVGEVDIHSFGSRFESFMSSLDERCGFVNVDYVRRFADYCFSLGLSAPRVYKYVNSVAKISRLMRKDFMEVTRSDVERFVANLERDKKISPWTKQNYKVALKFFFKWLKGGGEKYPPEVEWIKTTLRERDKILPCELLTEEDIMRLVEAAVNIRDKAFIITLYESGARISELASMRIADAQFNEKYVTLILKGKTGSRRVPVVAS